MSLRDPYGGGIYVQLEAGFYLLANLSEAQVLEVVQNALVQLAEPVVGRDNDGNEHEVSSWGLGWLAKISGRTVAGG